MKTAVSESLFNKFGRLNPAFCFLGTTWRVKGPGATDRHGCSNHLNLEQNLQNKNGRNKLEKVLE